MTTFGVISDVHGNALALRAALRELERRRVDRIVCLGDVVGYNPGSDQCVEMLRGADVETIAGNHDLIAIGSLGFDRCSEKPAFALRRTRRDLTASTRAYLEQLPGRRTLPGGAVLVHGGVRDVQLYLDTTARLVDNAAHLAADEPAADLCFFGHTHIAGAFQIARNTVLARANGRTVRLAKCADGRWFVNPGAIDASRKPAGEHAQFAIYDSDARTVEWITAKYDRAEIERRAWAAGYRMRAVDRWAVRTVRLVHRVARRIARLASKPEGGTP